MIPFILIAIAWWASSGVVSHIKTSRASNAKQAAAAGLAAAGLKTAATNGAGPATAATKTSRALAPGDVTFRQWQQSLYRRMQRKLRDRLPGQRSGKRVRDLLGDITAAALAVSLAFGMGFTLGGAWVGARTAHRHARKKAQEAAGTPKNGPGSSSGRRQPRNPQPETPPGGSAGSNPRQRRTPQDQTPPRHTAGTDGTGDDTVLDFELLDDGQAPNTNTNTSPFVSDEYADVVGQPQLLAHNPDMNGADMATEIINIHQLFIFAQQVTPAALEAVEQATIRRNSALERAEQAAIRGNVAVARAETAVQVAVGAKDQAAQLEATAAHFSGHNMDSDSLAAIYTAIEAANSLVLREQQRAEAEAQVAVDAEQIARDEQIAAEAADASAKAAMMYAEAVQAMHDTVQAHQMPHAEAQAATGNAAAHQSVLAAN